MRTISIALVLSICSISLMSGQRELTFSAHGGINYTNFLNADFLGFDYKYGVGYSVGAGLEIGLNEPWSLVTGLFYDKKTINLDYTIFVQSEMGNEVRDIRDTFSLNYIITPAMGRYAFISEKHHFFINGGLYTGFLFETTLSFENNTVTFNSIDAGLVVGAGVELPITERNNFIIEFRNYLGLADINPGQKTSNLNNVQLLVGVSF